MLTRIFLKHDLSQILIALFCTVTTLGSLQAIASDSDDATGEANSNPYTEALPAWSNTLARFVDDQGRTDFAALARQPEELETFITAITQISPASNPDYFPAEADVIAYHINAYNAHAMHGVILRDLPKDFSLFFKRAAFFKFHKITIGGASTNLYDYENKVIRPINEPRVHFALNCMVRDCPRLPKEVFGADTLEETLAALTREFFNKPTHIRVDHDKRTLYLSAILKFYTEDFVESGKKRDLIAYVNQYADEAIPIDYKVKFMNYDWTVNQQPE